MIAILGAILAIFSIILLHELGHFVVAKACGIKVVRFSIGFGKAIWKRTGKDGTEYVLAVLPLGGYIKMLGEGEERTAAEDAHRAFNQKPLLTRMSVVLAGPFTNFLLAVIAYWGVYLMGIAHTRPVIGQIVSQSIAAKARLQPGDQIVAVDGVQTDNWQRVMMAVMMRMGDRNKMQFLVKPPGSNQLQQRELDLSSWTLNHKKPAFFKSLGIIPYHPTVLPVIAKVDRGSAAATGGLREGDRVLTVNEQPVNDWVQMVQMVQARPDQKITMMVIRHHKKRTIHLKTGSTTYEGKQLGFLGVQSYPPQWPEHMIYKDYYSVFGAWVPAIQQAWGLVVFNFLVVVKMITGKISIHTLGGPITVFQAAGKASQAGFQVYLGFIGFISLTIGFINLLPIPGLDGGHLLFQSIEGIFRRPIPERYQMVGLSLGMIFLVIIMVQATINDLMRLF